jgi:hypothetical protein
VEIGELPAADGANVYVDKFFAGIITDSTASKREGCIPQFPGTGAGHPDINGHGLHVQAVLGHPARMPAQVAIAPRSTITANNLNLSFGLSYVSSNVVEQIEQPWINMVDIPGTVVAQKIFQLVHRLRHILLPDAINNINALLCVRVVEPQPMNFPDISRSIADSGIGCQGRDKCYQNES